MTATNQVRVFTLQTYDMVRALYIARFPHMASELASEPAPTTEGALESDIGFMLQELTAAL